MSAVPAAEDEMQRTSIAFIDSSLRYFALKRLSSSGMGVRM